MVFANNPRDLLERLESWKARFGTDGPGRLERLLEMASRIRFRTPDELIRLHETLLFLRAYPLSRRVARLADAILFSFARRVSELQERSPAFEDPEISGIDGTSLSAVFGYEVACRLAARHPRTIDIAWDRHDEADRLGPVLAKFVPMFREEWPVEAHVRYRDWIAAARGPHGTDLAWLLDRFRALPAGPQERSGRYESLQLPLTWNVKGSTSRSRLRIPKRNLFLHRERLLRRSDVSLASELEGPKLPVRRLPRREARAILDLIVDTSAMRYRELYGFSHPDEGAVFHADAGRGVDVFFFGVPPEWRLPLRAYHGGLFFKNGVPAGYVEVLSLFERAEVGFNLYYTFREGESAWLYAVILRLFRQVLGVNCFSVDPYQIGLENPEAIASGAFWFYRKLGFRPVRLDIERLTGSEEARMRRSPAYRSSKRTLERLSEGPVIYEGPGAEPRAWDNFRISNLGLAAASAQTADGWDAVLRLIPNWSGWSKQEQLSVSGIVAAKRADCEAKYLRLMQRHARLRAAVIALGSARQSKPRP
jgi:hypothetical protein